MNKPALFTASLLLCTLVGYSGAACSGDTWEQAKADATEMGRNAKKAPGEAWDTAKQAGSDGWDTTKSAGHEISAGATEFGHDVKDAVSGD